MSAYVDGVLINDERVMYRARISKWSLWPFIVFGRMSNFGSVVIS